MLLSGVAGLLDRFIDSARLIDLSIALSRLGGAGQEREERDS